MDQMDCGPTCLRMICKHYGKHQSLQKLRNISGINREGVSLLGISEAAEKIGFHTNGARVSLDSLKEVSLPVVIHWNQNHFVVLYSIRSNYFYVADPAKGSMKYNTIEFVDKWMNKGNGNNGEGIILLIEPTADFYSSEDEESKSLHISFFLNYFKKYKLLLVQLLLGLCVGSVIQLILPFIAQATVDIGINSRNLGFIHVILFAQGMLLVGRMSVDFLRSWILLHISTRINISILTEFLMKLMRLPMNYFDSKQTGDIIQRMNDQHRIESFLTGSTLTTIFSSFNLIVFAFVLANYDISIFLIFLISSILYVLWILVFLKQRRSLDFMRFDLSAKNQNSIFQLINGMQEIKLNNCEQQKRWEWERIQAKLFKFNIRSLALGQYQQAGTFFINEGKNILITFLVAKSVIDGHLTLGSMMAVQYIIGQLNGPIEQMVTFVQQFQDAKLSLERLNEIRDLDDEEPTAADFKNNLPLDKSINIENLTFTYPGAGNEPVLSGVNINIQQGKTTAIVGMSGSGKTTIIKLLLRFYQTKNDDIKIGTTSLNQISFKYWRNNCGAVMQEGFIFSDTIARNIAVGDEFPDQEKLANALKIANITQFVEELPLGLNTKIGSEGNGISQGQRQRLLIARAVYKNPEYIFFDEATNALDAHNELVILENLKEFLKNRTVVVVAHRLSTVKNADNIIVLDKGSVIEHGNHETLSKKRGHYYRLVKNQLELGN